MDKRVIQLELDLKQLIERRLTKNKLEDVKYYLTEMHEVHFLESDTLWQRLKDSDIISPSEGYKPLLDALSYVKEIALKDDAFKLTDQIKSICENQRGNARNNKRPVLKSQTSLDDRDQHKILLQDIARALDSNSSYIKRLKDFLCFRHPSHLTARDQESDMSGFDLLQMMERKDLLSRNNYHNLHEALEDIGLKKFRHAIEEACVNLGSDECASENRSEYKKDIPKAIGYVYDFGFKTKSVLEDLIQCGYKKCKKIDNTLKLPFDANLAIVLSDFDFNESSRVVCVPTVEQRIGIKPVVHFVNVRCQELPDPNRLPPTTCNTAHSFGIFLFTTDTGTFEKIWGCLSLYFEIPDPIEKICKSWLQDVSEEVERDTYRVSFSSTLERNLDLNLNTFPRRNSRP